MTVAGVPNLESNAGILRRSGLETGFDLPIVSHDGREARTCPGLKHNRLPMGWSPRDQTLASCSGTGSHRQLHVILWAREAR